MSWMRLNILTLYHLQFGIIISGWLNHLLWLVQRLLLLFLLEIDVHVGHIDILGILLIDKYIRFNKFNAFLVGADLHVEVGA